MLLRWRCEHWDAVTWQELMWNNPRVLRWTTRQAVIQLEEVSCIVQLEVVKSS